MYKETGSSLQCKTTSSARARISFLRARELNRVCLRSVTSCRWDEIVLDSGVRCKFQDLCILLFARKSTHTHERKQKNTHAQAPRARTYTLEYPVGEHTGTQTREHRKSTLGTTSTHTHTCENTRTHRHTCNTTTIHAHTTHDTHAHTCFCLATNTSSY